MSEATVARRRVRKIQRNVRRVVYFLILVGIAWFVHKYDVERIPDGFDYLAPQHMPAGSRIVLVDYDEDTVIGLGTVILYRPPGVEDRFCYGVVVGLPGERVDVQPVETGMIRAIIGDRRELLPVPAAHRIVPGVIPEGHYLLFNGDRDISSATVQPDSRTLGPIHVSRFRSKVVTPLYFFQ